MPCTMLTTVHVINLPSYTNSLANTLQTQLLNGGNRAVTSMKVIYIVHGTFQILSLSIARCEGTILMTPRMSLSISITTADELLKSLLYNNIKYITVNGQMIIYVGLIKYVTLRILILHKLAALSHCLCTLISARNKDQKLVGCILEDRIFYMLLITVPLKMYRKLGQPKWVLVSQILKYVGKWPMADCYF